MKAVATYLRALQLFAHNAHHLAYGPNFFSDHAFLGELYEAYESAYDSVIERIVGEEGTADLASINNQACKAAEATKIGDNDSSFSHILGAEKDLCKQIAKEVSDASDGDQNLLQGLADESLVRQYKLERRLKK